VQRGGRGRAHLPGQASAAWRRRESAPAHLPGQASAAWRRRESAPIRKGKCSVAEEGERTYQDRQVQRGGRGRAHLSGQASAAWRRRESAPTRTGKCRVAQAREDKLGMPWVAMQSIRPHWRVRPAARAAHCASCGLTQYCDVVDVVADSVRIVAALPPAGQSRIYETWIRGGELRGRGCRSASWQVRHPSCMHGRVARLIWSRAFSQAQR
jgi:hypothetical protein